MTNSNKFIATELFDSKGETGEKIVWNGIKRGFERRKCIAYWRYPIFSPDKLRKEPDILIADYQLGLIVIEVKAIRIEQLVNIQGHRWQYQNFYTDSGNPYQQAERQLYALLEYSDREPLLKRQVSARAMVALPYITQVQWQERGWANLPNSPPILWQEQLIDSELIVKAIANTHPLVIGSDLTPTQWELLQAVLGGTALYTPEHQQRNCSSLNTGLNRRKIIQQVRSRLNQLDLQQETLAKQIPPGMQRIRGVAGSGKTVALCQKAALMAVKYPQWQIALVFFSRSLYDSITQQVDRWIRYFTQDQMNYDPENSGLKILHAWGSKQQPGFYGTISRATGNISLSVPFTLSSQPNEALAEACLQLLENRIIPQIYDAVLIDEAQDLMTDLWLYQHKQPFYWLVYQSLRPINPISPQQRRLIWAYDELQSLGSLKLPEPVELFGEELGHLVTGQYNQQINKTEIISRSYRTPQQIIMVAQAIALGLLRENGLLTGSIYPEEWAALGYKVTGDWQLGNQITLTRESNSPHIISELWQGEMICFERFASRQQELTILAQKLQQNLTDDQLQPDREILIIVLGSAYEANTLLKHTATFLINQGLNIYLPSQRTYNCIDPTQQDNPNQFWYPGAITLSTIHRAKGQEADLVYLVGLDRIAQSDNISLRHQLFTALTRTRAWVNISGVGDYALYQELTQLMKSGDCLTFTVTSQPQRELRISDRASLIQGYALNRRNFRHANLRHADLSQMHLANINLIDADLSHANLAGANLTNAKLIAANLSHANLTNANLTNAKLMGADLTEANLTGTNLDRF
ncbi:MAG: pentapeptide repeat-containing protein [Pleurocapsa minor HA4230-MV1]|jgi:superfamily I DNA and RNA helicase|nr:pentapeptide repeat-containing protein [Pleurocapsa minor HA4230-MV1]